MRTKKKVVTGLAVAALATGVGLGVNAASGSTGGSKDNKDSPKFTSSITVPDDEQKGDKQKGDKQKGDDAAHEAAEEAEAAELSKLPGVIDAASAKAAALKAVSGTADSVELENEDGNVVWTVQVIDGAGLKTTVFVDAGTAKVLGTKAHDKHDKNGHKGEHKDDDQDDDDPDGD